MPDEENINEMPPELERYLALCQRIYERMRRDNSWPWMDSPNSQELIESEDKPPGV